VVGELSQLFNLELFNLRIAQLRYCCKKFLNCFMAEPIESITLPPATDPQKEREWLRTVLHHWLDEEFIPEAVNWEIANRASQVFMRQRMEGENDLGSLVIAIVTEMKGFDLSNSFFGEFAVANAVSDLLLESLGIERCCGQ
jgi:hypothetical protein